MKTYKTLLALLAVLVMLLFGSIGLAQEPEEGAGETAATGDVPTVEVGDITLPAWFENLAIAGLALAPVTVAVVQVLKVIGARVGLPEGYSGYITLFVSAIMVALALSAGFLQMEPQVAESLEKVQRFAEAMLTLLAALGWYQVGKAAQIVRPVMWTETE